MATWCMCYLCGEHHRPHNLEGCVAPGCCCLVRTNHGDQVTKAKHGHHYHQGLQIEHVCVSVQSKDFFSSPTVIILPRSDLEKTGILGSWILRNICQNPQNEEQLTMICILKTRYHALKSKCTGGFLKMFLNLGILTNVPQDPGS